MKKIRQESKGITLIALIITIIVLLILAGITIGALTSNNGVLTQGVDSKTKTEIANEKEILKLVTFAAMEKNGEGYLESEIVKKELDKYPEVKDKEDVDEGIAVTYKSGRTYLIEISGEVSEYTIRRPEPTPEESTLAELSTMTYGVVEIEFLKKTGYEVTNNPNEPILKEGMKGIYWDGTEEKFASNTNEWYKYEAQTGTTESGGTSRWANSKTIDGSYYVWIPRYAYRIVYFDNATHREEYRAGTLSEDDALSNGYILGYSDARGIVDKDGKRLKNVKSYTAIAVNDKKFRVHPSFDGNVNEGGWDKKIEGFWVAKFEARVSNGNVLSIPNVDFTRLYMNDAFSKAKKVYGDGDNINTTLNPHMVKNSEWGAIAYLAHSKFGRNGTRIELENRDYSWTTGKAEGDYLYDSEIGKLISTTGNIYGIYGMAGGPRDYVTAFFKGTSNENISIYTPTGESDKYSTGYTGDSIKNMYIPGDATYETNGWTAVNRNTILDNNNPYWTRGGAANYGNTGGAFLYEKGQGIASDSYYGLRVCLTIIK